MPRQLNDATTKMSVRRMHFKADGSPKKPVGRAAAKRMRQEGWRTYLCPFCGQTHASKKYAGVST